MTPLVVTVSVPDVGVAVDNKYAALVTSELYITACQYDECNT